TLRTDIHDVNVHVLHLGAEDFACQKKTLFVAPSCTVPTERISGKHPRRAALLRLECIEAIPGAQVDERLALQVLRKVEPFKLAVQHFDRGLPGREEAIPEFERMEPSRWLAAIGNLVDALLIGGDLCVSEGRIAP